MNIISSSVYFFPFSMIEGVKKIITTRHKQILAIACFALGCLTVLRLANHFYLKSKKVKVIASTPKDQITPLDFFRNSIWLIKLPFLTPLLSNFSTICSHMLSKFANKSAQKSSIFSTKASFERSPLKNSIFQSPPKSDFKTSSSVHSTSIKEFNSLEKLLGNTSPNKYEKWVDKKGKVYEGNLKNGLIEGKGSVYIPDKEITIQGMFSQGKLNGQAIIFYHNGGNSEEATFNQYFNGTTQINLPYGTYQGEVDLIWPEGRGKFTGFDGRSLEGFFLDGIFVKGTAIDAQKITYSGIFKNGHLIKGTITHPKPDERIYEGEFHNDLLNGYGTFTDSTTVVYKGNFQDNLLEGLGKATLPDGSQMEVQFIQGEPCGSVRIIDVSGMELNGFFTNLDNGRKRLTVKQAMGNEMIFEGEMRGVAFHGERKITHTNGTMISSHCINGKSIGITTITWPDNRESLLKISQSTDYLSKVIYPNGSIFIGEVKNELGFNFGTLTYSDGTSDQGEFYFFTGEPLERPLE